MIAIRNMDMPKSCDECKCGKVEKENGLYACSLTNEYFDQFNFDASYNWKNKRDIDCPLVEIKVESEA